MFFRDAYNGGSEPGNFYIALVTAANAPDADTNTLGELTEISAGNGYTSGGYPLNRDATDFDTLAQRDTTDRAVVQIKDVVWTASGGTIPAGGTGARYAVLTNDHATLSSREVLAFWDLGAPLHTADGNTLELVDLELRMRE
jgi:hypothetical protein